MRWTPMSSLPSIPLSTSSAVTSSRRKRVWETTIAGSLTCGGRSQDPISRCRRTGFQFRKEEQQKKRYGSTAKYVCRAVVSVNLWFAGHDDVALLRDDPGERKTVGALQKNRMHDATDPRNTVLLLT